MRWLSSFTRPLFLLLLCFGIEAVLPHGALATVRNFSSSHEWEAKVIEHSALPPRVVAVDKKQQVLSLLEFRSSLESTTTYLCSTGQAPGDKVVEGDLKTPEGIYFVVQHLTSGLDFGMYGYEAYTLNYPNPVDKLRKKTGYGIWLHGKGNGIAPLQTQGCIALNNNDLHTLGNKLATGLPVIISSSVDLHTPSDQKVANIQRLQNLSQGWAKAWENRSATMFDFYDAEAYSLANEPFSHFKSNKERLFKRLAWIKNTIRDVQVLEGPGYWVTWFYQDYQAPNLTSKGVRRLYWSDDKKGNFKIVGMEWLPGLNTSAQLVKEDPPVPPIDKAPKTETVPQRFDTIIADVEPSSTPSGTLADKGTSGTANTPTRAVVATNTHGDSVKSPSTAEKTLSPSSVVDEQEEKAPLLVASTTGGVFGAAHSTNPLPEKKRPTPTEVAPPSSEPILAEATPTVPVQPLAPSTDTNALTANSSQGTRPEDRQQTAQTTTSPTVAQETPASKAVSDKTVLNTIEKWRTAWEKGDIQGYVSSYATNAVQDRRTSKHAIEQHKLGLWKRAHPQNVQLSNIRIKRNGDTIIATMQQKYSSRNGTGDKGTKTLHLKQSGNTLLIVKEMWSAR